MVRGGGEALEEARLREASLLPNEVARSSEPVLTNVELPISPDSAAGDDGCDEILRAKRLEVEAGTPSTALESRKAPPCSCVSKEVILAKDFVFVMASLGRLELVECVV